MAAALPADDFGHKSVEIRGRGSHCTVHWRQWDRNDPEPITVSCGKRDAVVDREYHGFVAAKLSACHVIILTQNPSVHSVDNCAGKLRTTNLGVRWEAQLIQRSGIKASRIDRQLYEAKGKAGCYRVTLLYPHTADPGGSSYDRIEGDFCVPPLPKR